MRKWILALCVFQAVSCSSLKQDKEAATLYLQMGTSHLENGNYPYALRDLLKAEKLDSQNPLIQNNLGQVYFFRQRYGLAEQHFKKAIEIQNSYSDARNSLARVYIEQGKYVLAEKELKIVLNDLTYAAAERAYINLGLARFNQQQYPAARKAFEKALELQNDNCIASDYLGRSYFEEQNYQRGAEALDKAIGFCQKDLIDGPHYYSALAYYRLGDRSKSIARFEEVVKLYPNGKYREKAKGMLDLIRKGH